MIVRREKRLVAAEMEQQALQEALSIQTSRNRFKLAWDNQQVFVAIPTQDELSGKEWRLSSRVVSMGELMMALGGQYSARDIDRFWKSLVVAAEKRQCKEHRNKKGAAAH